MNKIFNPYEIISLYHYCYSNIVQWTIQLNVKWKTMTIITLVSLMDCSSCPLHTTWPELRRIKKKLIFHTKKRKCKLGYLFRKPNNLLSTIIPMLCWIKNFGFPYWKRKCKLGLFVWKPNNLLSTLIPMLSWKSWAQVKSCAKGMHYRPLGLLNS